MISIELYNSDRGIAYLTRQEGDSMGAWSRLQEALARGITGGGPNRIEVRIDVLLSELEIFREIKRLFGTSLEFGENFKSKLQTMGRDRRERESAILAPSVTMEQLSRELQQAGFKRTLKPFQMQNLARLSSLPHGADFSVPGAGKTTVALSNYAIQKTRNRVDKLLVIAPIAAFSAWKDDSVECFEKPPLVCVHIGKESAIPKNADILLTNYHRLASDFDNVREWAVQNKAHVILDEAHRVKRGRGGTHGSAVLDLAFSSVRRDVLTGTPAPQGAFDLVALVKFLYPGQANQILPQNAFVERLGRQQEVLEETHAALSKYFVRTCKSDLGLPSTNMTVIERPMGTVQKAIYDSLLGQYRGQFKLGDNSRQRFRKLGQILMYLLESATNPLLITAGSDEDDLPHFEHPPIDLTGDEHVSDLLRRYAEYETPWKYEEIRRIVAHEHSQGGKVLVWTTFVRNIRFLERILKSWNPAVVHGGVPPRDGAPPSANRIREDEIERFKNDTTCSVLLANPAACGEGVSLHHWCHHAVYIDRTFNAGHFLQSQDRIHRLGLSPEIRTQFTILASEGSIDGFVDQRLREKVRALSILMNDPGLVQVSLPSEDDIGRDEFDEQTMGSSAFDQKDAEALIAHLGGE